MIRGTLGERWATRWIYVTQRAKGNLGGGDCGSLGGAGGVSGLEAFFSADLLVGVAAGKSMRFAEWCGQKAPKEARTAPRGQKKAVARRRGPKLQREHLIFGVETFQ